MGQVLSPVQGVIYQEAQLKEQGVPQKALVYVRRCCFGPRGTLYSSGQREQFLDLISKGEDSETIEDCLDGRDFGALWTLLSKSFQEGQIRAQDLQEYQEDLKALGAWTPKVQGQMERALGPEEYQKLE